MEFKERIQARDEIDARGDHGRCVNECRHRRRTFHRIGKPGKQRELRAFSKRAEHDEIRNCFASPRSTRAIDTSTLHRFEERGVLEAAVIDPDEKDTQRQTRVTNAVHDEGFLRGIHSTRLGVVVANEQVAREAHAFPTEIEQNEIAAHHQRAHREEEDAHATEETRVALTNITFHVLSRVDRDE